MAGRGAQRGWQALLACGALIAGVLAPGSSLSLSGEDCDVRLRPGTDLQAVVESAAPGSVLCLLPGEWRVNLVLRKPLTLRGLGEDREAVRLKGIKPGHPIVFIPVSASPVAGTIALERLSLEEAKPFEKPEYPPLPCVRPSFDRCAFGVQIGTFAEVSGPEAPEEPTRPGPAPAQRRFPPVRSIRLRDVAVGPEVYVGVFVNGPVALSLEGVRVREDPIFYDVRVDRAARVTGRGLQAEFVILTNVGELSVQGAALGILLMGDVAEGRLTDLEAKEVLVGGGTRLTLERARILGSKGPGLVVGGRAHVTLEAVRISDHLTCGLWVVSPDARVDGREVHIRGNGLDLCGYAPASLYTPKRPQTDREELRVPEDYPTLQEAIDAVAPNGTVVLRAGKRTLKEGVVVWKPVRIVGAGPLLTTVRGWLSVLADAEHVTLKGFKLQPKPEIPPDAREVDYARFPLLMVYSEARLEELRVEGSPGSGVLVGGRARVTAEGVSLRDNGWIGFIVSEEARVEVRNARFYDNFVYDLLAERDAYASVAEASFYGGGGLAVHDAATLKVHKTTLQRVTHGLEFFGTPQATLRDTTIQDCAREGIRSGGRVEHFLRGKAGSIVLERVRIDDCHTGVDLGVPLEAVVRDSVIQRSHLRGILVSNHRVRLELVRTRIEGSGWCGLEVTQAGATIRGRDNEIWENGPDLCGYAPPSLRLPRAPQTASQKVRVPDDYESVQEAVDAVPPGGTVQLGEGVFAEAVTLWKPVVLRGAGPALTTVRAADEMYAPLSVPIGVRGVRVEDLSVVGDPSSRILLYGDARLSHLEIQGLGCCEGALRISGGATVVLQDVRMRGTFAPLHLADGAQATLVRSSIVDNKHGIELSGGVRLRLEESRIQASGKVAIQVEAEIPPPPPFQEVFAPAPEGHPRVEVLESTIVGHEEAGIQLNGRGELLLRGSELRENGYGVVVERGVAASLTVEGNRFVGNDLCAIAVYAEGASIAGADNELDDNAVPLCGYAPVGLRKPLVPQTPRRVVRVPDDYPTLQEAADALAPGGTLVLGAGEVEGRLIVTKPLTVQGQGADRTRLVKVQTDSVGVVVPHGVRGVRLEGLTLQGDETSIALYGAGEASLRGVRVAGYGAGFVLVGRGRLDVQSAAVEANVIGIALGDRAQATLRDAVVRGSEEIALVAVGEAKLSLLEGTRIVEHRGRVGIALGERAWARIEGAEIRDNQTFAPPIGLLDRATLEVADSRIVDNDEGAVIAGDEALVTITRSTLSGNDGIAVVVAGQARVVVEQSAIEGNAWRGLTALDSGQLVVRDSVLADNAEEALFAKGTALVELSGNRIEGHKECAILVEEPGVRVTGSDNTMRDNAVDLCGYAPASIRRPLVPPTGRQEVRVPEDYPTLQEAIDAVAPGGTVHVAEGTFQGGLTIWKPVTLKGAGLERTTIDGTISTIADVQGVTVRDLRTSFSRLMGFLLYGQGLVLERVEVAHHLGYSGIVLGGQATATFRDVRVYANRGPGLLLHGGARLNAQNLRVEGNTGDGIDLRGSATLHLEKGQIANNGNEGVALEEEAQATLIDVLIEGNGARWPSSGVRTEGPVRLKLRAAIVRQNSLHGLSLSTDAFSSEPGVVELEDSIVEKNGLDTRCEDPNVLCNGITVDRNLRLKVSRSEVRGNADWGIAAKLAVCGYPWDSFEGKVALQDVVVEGNNTTGNQAGKGNPGDHPFRDGPDGQVCLP